MVKLMNDNINMGWAAKPLHPALISDCMLRRKNHVNLNELSIGAVYDLVGSLLARGIAINHVHLVHSRAARMLL